MSFWAPTPVCVWDAGGRRADGGRREEIGGPGPNRYIVEKAVDAYGGMQGSAVIYHAHEGYREGVCSDLGMWRSRMKTRRSITRSNWGDDGVEDSHPTD